MNTHIKNDPQYTAFTPYRVCPIGTYSDHQLGKITGFAINKGIHIAYGPKKTIGQIILRGATIALNKRYPLRRELCAVLDGDFPIGDLSSSAAVIYLHYAK